MTRQRVVLQPHDSRWATEFANESSAVAAALGDALLTIHHIGSTAIPGIHAKPIIDMLAVTGEIAILDKRSSQLAELGYEVLGEFGIPGRRYFRKDNTAGERTHQIHAFQKGSSQITRHLAFRDYLIAHPAAAHDYDTLKHQLAMASPNDIRSYTTGKDAFIQGIDSRAARWISE